MRITGAKIYRNRKEVIEAKLNVPIQIVTEGINCSIEYPEMTIKDLIDNDLTFHITANNEDGYPEMCFTEGGNTLTGYVKFYVEGYPGEFPFTPVFVREDEITVSFSLEDLREYIDRETFHLSIGVLAIPGYLHNYYEISNDGVIGFAANLFLNPFKEPLTKYYIPDFTRMGITSIGNRDVIPFLDKNSLTREYFRAAPGITSSINFPVEIWIFGNITTVYAACFNEWPTIEKFVLFAETPPALQSVEKKKLFGGNTVIDTYFNSTADFYVPDDSIEDYKMAWSNKVPNLNSRIHGLSELL